MKKAGKIGRNGSQDDEGGGGGSDLTYFHEKDLIKVFPSRKVFVSFVSYSFPIFAFVQNL